MRLILEYEFVVWNSFTLSDANQIERVQQKYLRFAGFILKMPHAEHDYTPVAKFTFFIQS